MCQQGDGWNQDLDDDTDGDSAIQPPLTTREVIAGMFPGQDPDNFQEK